VLLQPTSPIVVEVIDAPTRETTVVDVLVGAIGLTGALLVSAVLLGALAGAVLVGLRIWRARREGVGGERIRLDLSPALGASLSTPPDRT
jgi:hypothetical protein